MEYTKESFFKHLDGCLFTRVNSSFKNWLINRGDLAYCIKYQENPTTYIEEEMLVFCEKEFDYDMNVAENDNSELTGWLHEWLETDEYVKDQKEKFAQEIKNLQNAWTDFYDFL